MTESKPSILNPDDDAPDYDRLWSGIYAGGRRPRSPRARLAQASFDRAGTEARRAARLERETSGLLEVAMRAAVPPAPDPEVSAVFVESVQCIGALDWIVRRYSPRVIVLVRGLLNTVASWNQLDFVRNPRELATLAAYAHREWGVEPPPPGAPVIAHQTFVIATQMAMLRAARDRHADWTVASHEELCVDAPARLGALAISIGLGWSETANDAVRASNREGSDPFGTQRVTSIQPERWRERLSTEDLAEISGVVERFVHPAGGIRDRVQQLRR